MDPVTALERLGGVASLAELTALCGRHRVRVAVSRGRIVRCGRGRYALPSAPASRRTASRLAGVVSHLSAAEHWGWGVAWRPERPWVTVPRRRRVSASSREVAVVVQVDLTSDQVVSGVTRPVRTVLDCARRLPFGEALAVADSALRSGLVTAADLGQAAGTSCGPGAGRCRRVAATADGRAANPFESMLRAICLEVPGLRVEPQVAVHAGRTTYHPDLVDRDLRLAVEADSWQFHADREGHARDCVRYTELTLAGWRVVRFTWEQVMLHPAYVRNVLTRVVRAAAATRTDSAG